MKTRKLAILSGIAFLTLAAKCGGDPLTGVGEHSASVGGTVTVEADPLEGITVSYTAVESADTVEINGTVVTDENGAYLIVVGDIVNNVSVDISIPQNPTPETRFAEHEQSVVLEEGYTLTADFEGTYVRTASITGTVVAGSDGLEGVTVTLAGPNSAQTTTDADGRYAFPDLRAGTYTVTISGYPEDVTFESTQHDVDVDVGENATRDFAGTRPEPTVTVTAWTDGNGNSVDLNDVAGDLLLQLDIDPAGRTVAECEVRLTDDSDNTFGFVTDGCSYTADSGDPETYDAMVHGDWVRFENGVWTDPEDSEPADWLNQFSLLKNGPQTVVVEVTDDEGETWESEPTTVTLNNSNTLQFGFSPSALEVSGASFYGGEDVSVYVQPFIHDDTDADHIEIQVTPGTQTANGTGTIVVEQAPDGVWPFIFTISLAENAGGNEDALGNGPDGEGGAGSDICALTILNAGGSDVTDRFSHLCRPDNFFDFGSPTLTDPELLIDGDWFTQGYYSGEPGDGINVFGLDGAVDGGIGVEPPELGGGAIFDIVDQTGTVLFSDVQSTGDLPENALGGTGMYMQCRDVTDLLGNRIPAADMPECRSNVEIAIDRGAPFFFGPDAETITGSFVHFQVQDPELAGTLDPPAPGAGVMDYGCASNCTGVSATVLAGPVGAPEELTCRSDPEYLGGDYSGTVGLSSSNDPGGLDPDIFNVPDTWPYTLDISLTVTLQPDGSLTITGPAPWVDVSGALGTGTYPDEFVATGTGTVAGVDNVAVQFDGRLIFAEGLIFGAYTMGTGGELTGGESIEYRIEVTFQGDLEAATGEFIMVMPETAPDGSYTVEVEAGDWAWPPNMATDQFTFILNRGG